MFFRAPLTAKEPESVSGSTCSDAPFDAKEVEAEAVPGCALQGTLNIEEPSPRSSVTRLICWGKSKPTEKQISELKESAALGKGDFQISKRSKASSTMTKMRNPSMGLMKLTRIDGD
jgi:hypothetical protein